MWFSTSVTVLSIALLMSGCSEQKPLDEFDHARAFGAKLTREFLADARAKGLTEQEIRAKEDALVLDGMRRLDDNGMRKFGQWQRALLDSASADECVELVRGASGPKIEVATRRLPLLEQRNAGTVVTLAEEASLALDPVVPIDPAALGAGRDFIFQHVPEGDLARFRAGLSRSDGASPADICWAWREFLRLALELERPTPGAFFRALFAPSPSK